MSRLVKSRLSGSNVKLPLVSTQTLPGGPDADLRPAVDREAGDEVAAGHAVAAGERTGFSCGSSAFDSPSSGLPAGSSMPSSIRSA